MKERYLGDGVYATYNGYSITLDLREQDDSKIVLEPKTMYALKQFNLDILELSTQPESST